MSESMELKERIGVVGLGYVGLPVAVAFGRSLSGTIGFDIDAARIDELSAGFDRNGDLSAEALAAARLRLTTDPNELAAVSFFVIAVPTPLGPGRTPDLSAVESAARTVGSVLSEGAVVVLESTVWPGVTEEVLAPTLAAVSGLEAGVDFFVAYSPERINPGDHEHTFERVVKVVAASDSEVLDRVARVYGAVVEAGVFKAPSVKAAELSKLLENTQRDLNVALMNELAVICDRLQVPTRDVLSVAKTKWNHLDFEPGLVGGHCISVDPYYLTARAQAMGLHPEVILAGRRTNDTMASFIAKKTVKLLAEAGRPALGAKIAVLGVTFKEDFPDVRNSLVGPLMDDLESYGCEVYAVDPIVDEAQAALAFGRALVSLDRLSGLDAVVLAVKHSAFRAALGELFGHLADGGVLVDVKRIVDPSSVPSGISYWSL
ncbi:MAG TPA: nucleotide sugar dehydrogenase [Myxococcota bacterium]|nr:nucleotide sugar dehydrogenase [Myxococcota bacterium]